MHTSFTFSAALLAGLFIVAAVDAQTVDSATRREADNTRSNATDRNEDSTTPVDQSNDKDAIDVTADIRRAVLADTSLSMSAHNIKIVTNKNVVTLRGSVESADEKKRIESLATKSAPGKQVRNEISIAR